MHVRTHFEPSSERRSTPSACAQSAALWIDAETLIVGSPVLMHEPDRLDDGVGLLTNDPLEGLRVRIREGSP
jgi:hypothetical protein